MEKTVISIEGMSCGHCSNAVKNLVEEVDGIETVEVDLGTNEARVSYNPAATNAQAIIDNINSSNTYKATQK
jgi:copper chaperone CopZ